jgi:serine protease Do
LPNLTFIIDTIGHVLTIGYLIIEAEHIELIGPKGKTVTATFVGYDFNTGFGILFPDEPLNVIPMKLGRSSEVKEGDHLFVASFGGLDSVQTVRVISRMEFAGYWEYLLENAIFSSPPHPNFGGAALIDRDGCLLGIGSLYTRFSIPGVGLIPCNVFVPIDLLRPILTDLIDTGISREPPRPWLGLHAEESHGRVFIIRVTAGGPAEKAGFRLGDIVLTVNGVEVSGLADFYRKIWALGSAGVDVHLGVLQ